MFPSDLEPKSMELDPTEANNEVNMISAKDLQPEVHTAFMTPNTKDHPMNLLILVLPKSFTWLRSFLVTFLRIS